ncbi:MmcQ/YjbR family DNA-binding protein [Gammaproteobacteria bacterium]|nr:MmcQ/YjbR family DNA-binding protein [Gammaproteobacteria bacterium]
MNYEQAKQYLLSKAEAIEDYPFGPDIVVCKIRGKMFATLAEQDNIPRTNLKCDPDEALALRDIFPSIIPGYHMNKKHWNTIILDDTIPVGEIERMMDNSYSLVVQSLPKAKRWGLESTLEATLHTDENTKK